MNNAKHLQRDLLREQTIRYKVHTHFLCQRSTNSTNTHEEIHKYCIFAVKRISVLTHGRQQTHAHTYTCANEKS